MVRVASTNLGLQDCNCPKCTNIRRLVENLARALGRPILVLPDDPDIILSCLMTEYGDERMMQALDALDRDTHPERTIQ